MTTVIKIAAVAVAALWVYLVFSGSGILITGTSPAYQGSEKQRSIQCTYFTGTQLVTTSFWYSANGLFGKSVCPRWRDFS